MKTTTYIVNELEKIPEGMVFSYSSFLRTIDEKEAVIKALNRLVMSGKISKLAKGKFYKSEQSTFGDLFPSQFEIVKDLLQKKNTITGYLTGFSIYNQLGFTSQVSNRIQIGKNQLRAKLTRGIYTISFLLQKNTITKETIPLLQILDCIRTIKEIPDSTIENSCIQLLRILKELNKKTIEVMIPLSLNYPPSTRAMLGALLEQNHQCFCKDQLQSSLNPITTYKYSGVEKVLKYSKNWNLQ